MTCFRNEFRRFSVSETSAEDDLHDKSTESDGFLSFLESIQCHLVLRTFCRQVISNGVALQPIHNKVCHLIPAPSRPAGINQLTPVWFRLSHMAQIFVCTGSTTKPKDSARYFETYSIDMKLVVPQVSRQRK